ILPDNVWRNYCKLVFGMRIIYQKHITQDQLREAHISLVQWAREFEQTIYVKNRIDRMHFRLDSMQSHIATSLNALFVERQSTASH
ncbi:hypothetical protein MPER_14062, partial [Moniliophthora perniciosa FA553]